MESAEQLLRKAIEKQKQKDSLLNKPFVANVISINPEKEQFTISTPNGNRKVDFKNPFSGINSWIRACPELGIKPLVQYRSDRNEPAVLTYHQEEEGQRIEKYLNAPNGVYRLLRQGEIEVSSKGFAQSYYADRPIYEARGGICRLWLNQDELESGAKAPIHVQYGIEQQSGLLQDIKQFGILKRWEGSTANVINPYYPKLEGKFKKEDLSFLSRDGGKPLVYKREGDVSDEKGKAVAGFAGPNLRALYQFYTKTNPILEHTIGNTTRTEVQIDEQGNAKLHMPSEASLGLHVRIPNGEVDFTIYKDFKILSEDRSYIAQLEQNYTIKTVKGYYEQTIKKYIKVKTESYYDESIKEYFKSKIDQYRETDIGQYDKLTIGKTLVMDVGESTSILSAQKAQLQQPKIAIGYGQVELLLTLVEIFTAIGTLTVPTPVGPTAPFTTAPQWSKVAEGMTKITSITGTFF